MKILKLVFVIISAIKSNTLTVFSNAVQYNCSNGAQTLTTIPIEIELAKHLLLFVAYYELDQNKSFSKGDRNAIIRTRYGKGELISKLAEDYNISPQRVHQIVNFKNK